MEKDDLKQQLNGTYYNINKYLGSGESREVLEELLKTYRYQLARYRRHGLDDYWFNHRRNYYALNKKVYGELP
jgi:hypothetical protein